MKKTLEDIEAEEGTIKALILADSDGEVSYIKDAAERGCVGGNCNNLIYHEDTHNFYQKHAEEIDDILAKMEEDLGEPYNITENMKRLGQYDLRNFLAWMAYEVVSQEIIQELEGGDK